MVPSNMQLLSSYLVCYQTEEHFATGTEEIMALGIFLYNSEILSVVHKD